MHLFWFFIYLITNNNFIFRLEIKSREERSQQYFGGAIKDWNYDEWGGESSEMTNQAPRVMSQQQLMMLEENSSFVEQREKEIQNVVRSIFELNTIFKVSWCILFYLKKLELLI